MSSQKIFKTPSNISFPAVGVDFSSKTIRFLKLKRSNLGLIPEFYFERDLPENSFIDGEIIDKKSFVNFLKQIKKEKNIKYVRLAIPESKVFLFTLSIDISKDKNIEKYIYKNIEEYTLLKSREAVFDYSILGQKGNALTLQVVCAPQKYINDFVSTFESAGMYIVSAEFDAQAIARASISENDNGTKLVVDIGANHTGISIVSNGVVVYSETIKFGGKILNDALAKRLNISLEEVEDRKKVLGLTQRDDKDFFDVLSTHLSPLVREIDETFKYWQVNKSRHLDFSSIDKVYICGGHSNMKALDEYLSAVLKIDVERVNPWINCFSFNKYIPELTLEESVSYVPAIGIALSNHILSTNLLPKKNKDIFYFIRRYRYINSIIWGIIWSCLAFVLLLAPSYLILDNKEKEVVSEYNIYVNQNSIPNNLMIEDYFNRIDKLNNSFAYSEKNINPFIVKNDLQTDGVYIQQYSFSEGILILRGEFIDQLSLDEYLEKTKMHQAVLDVEHQVFIENNKNVFSLTVKLK